jgi:low temperature requirement protein LtrA
MCRTGHKDSAARLGAPPGRGGALFLAGHLPFRRTVSGTWVRSRLTGLAALLVLVPVAAATERIVVSLLATLTVLGVAASDTLHGRTR